jgi:hypothetical protein
MSAQLPFKLIHSQGTCSVKFLCCPYADTQGGPRSPSSAAPSSSTTSSRLQALFTVCRGLLVLLLPKEVLLFDLAMGAPAASTALPANLAPFSSLLGVYGSGVCQGGGDDGGVDFLYALHTGEDWYALRHCCYRKLLLMQLE